MRRKRKKPLSREGREYAQQGINTTLGAVVGVVGISAVSGIAGPLGGLPGTIIKSGALPMMGVGVMKGVLPKERKRR